MKIKLIIIALMASRFFVFAKTSLAFYPFAGRKKSLNFGFLFTLFIVFSGFCMASPAYGAAPVVFFSDMTDGVNHGFDGDATKGVAVTIWGLRFGSSGTVRVASASETSYIDIASADCPEWGANTNPKTARGLERITFHLTSAMNIGASLITVTTPEGMSNSIPFYVRNAGNIYFIAPSGGNDSSAGTSKDSPWATPSHVRATLQAGDVCYFRGGEYTNAPDIIPGHAGSMGMMTFYSGYYNPGMENNSITITSYPGEEAYLHNTTTTYQGQYGGIFQGGYGQGHWDYWTFSKFKLSAYGNCFQTAYNYQSNGSFSSHHIRIVGNDMTTQGNPDSSGEGINYYSNGSLANGGGCDQLSIYGNYIHDLNVNNHGEEPACPNYKNYGMYIGGQGSYGTVDIGWNEGAYIYGRYHEADGVTVLAEPKQGRLLQIYGHSVNDSVQNLFVHDNYIHHTDAPEVFGGGDPGSPLYLFLQNAYIYNNIIVRTGYAWDGITPVDNCSVKINAQTNGREGGNFYIYNNIISNGADFPPLWIGEKSENMIFRNNIIVNKGGTYCTYHPDNMSINDISMFFGDHNIWYGNGQGGSPSWDNSALDNNTDPFLALNPDYTPKEGFLGINAGTEIESSSIFARDFAGTIRGSSWDIGPYEYGSSGIPIDIVAPVTPTGLAVN